MLIMAKLAEISPELNEIIISIQDLLFCFQKLEKMINDRTLMITTIERLTSLRVQHMFQILMHLQKYRVIFHAILLYL
mgnify:CR=1 FL=1